MADAKLQIILSAKDNASKVLKGVDGSFGKIAKTAGIASLAVGGFALAIGVGAVKQAAKFESAMSDINTLFDDNGESIAELEKGVKDLLKTIPKDAEDLGASAYAIVSAGISDTSQALEVLESAGKLAVAGLGETSEATDILTSAINAFNIDASESEDVANSFFLAVKNGKTTVSELAQGFGQVAPIANEMGIELNDLLSSVSAMTTSGMKASIAYTSVKAALSNMIKPTKDMQDAFSTLGINVDDIKESLGEQGLVATLQMLSDAVDGDTEKLAGMFGSVEGLNAVMMLLGETGENADEIFKAMGGTLDALDIAFEKQTETFDKQFQLLKNNLNIVLIELGAEILPMVNKALEPLIGSLQVMSGAVSNAGGIFSFFKEKISEVIQFIENNTGLITVLKQAFDDVAIVFQENLLPELQKLWEALQPLMPFLEIMAKVIGVILLGAIIVFIKLLEVGLITAINILTSALEGANKVIEFFKNIWESVTDDLAKVVGAIDAVIEAVKRLNVLKSVSGAIGNFLGFGGERANGGSVSAGKSFLVGERGPEMFNPTSNGVIVPNNKLGGGVTINITGTFLDEDSGEKVGDLILQKLKLQGALG